MKKIANKIALLLLLACLLPVPAQAAQMLVPVGQAVGLELTEGSVTVAAIDDGLGSSAKTAGLRQGDTIVSIDGAAVHSAADVHQALERSDGAVDVVVERGGGEKRLRIHPAITPDGPRLGVYLREGITGIGTVTWYDPDTHCFGALGHGVSDSRGNLLDLTGGQAYQASIASVKRGASGEPGQLRGAVAPEQVLGELTANTSQGVFGRSETGWPGQALPVAGMEEIATGEAAILTTVSGSQPRMYCVEILKIYPKSGDTGRNLLLHVTDPALLQETGGIVQGMSGSPIVQNGKLIGAVTHVLVNDPTTGYGISIEAMLKAAQ